MRYPVSAFAFVVALSTFPNALQAQSDAERALAEARTKFENQEFESARDLLITAAQTDSENPDVFLMLGRAQYQLGSLDDALKAWQRTLQLAPEQAYAKRMTAALQGTIHDTDVRLEVVRSLLDQRLLEVAHLELQSIKSGTLKAEQRSQWLVLEAESLIAAGQGMAGLRPLRELAVRDPDRWNTPAVRLLTAKAKLTLDQESIRQALDTLAEIETTNPDDPVGRSAALALLSFRAKQGIDVIDPLHAWVAANPDHPEARVARSLLVDTVSIYMAEAARQPAPSEDDPATELDNLAVKSAEVAFANVHEAELALSLARQTVDHLHRRWVQHGAFDRAISALESLLAIDQPISSRLLLSESLTSVGQARSSKRLDTILSPVLAGDASPETIEQWIAGSADHPRLAEARVALVHAHVEQARRLGPAAIDGPLSQPDQSALAAAKTVIKSDMPASEKSQLVAELLRHLETRYSAANAHGAAISAHELLLQFELSRSLRRNVLQHLAQARTEFALSGLVRQANAGTLEHGPLPASLAALLETLQQINREYPAEPAWAQQVSVAERTGKLVRQRPPPASKLAAADRWTLDFAIPVIIAHNDAATTSTAIKLVNAIVDRYASAPRSSVRRVALQTNAELFDSLPQEHPKWVDTLMRQIALYTALDHAIFHENMKTGRRQLNTQLTDDGRSLLELASSVVAHQPSKSAEVVAALQPLLQLRSDVGADEFVRTVYSDLVDSLEDSQKRLVQLEIAKSRIDQVLGEHTRLLANGFQPPLEFDERLRIALASCYELSGKLPEDDPFSETVRQTRARVVSHYRNLQNYDAAESAILVTAEQQNAQLDANAQFEVATLHLSIAIEELERQTQRYKGRETILLTPAIRECIAELQQFVTDHPTESLVRLAAAKIVEIGARYESYESYDLAAEVYRDLEEFAADNDSLQEIDATAISVASRAAMAAAEALHKKANRALTATTATHSVAAGPPNQVSPEFTLAIEAFRAVMAQYPDGPLANQAITKITDIAMAYADIGAWDVAATIYEGLEQQDVPLRQPERLQLARALCEMGKVMPRHSRQILSALSLGQTQAETAPASGLNSAAIAGAVGSAAPAATNAPEMDDPFGDVDSAQVVQQAELFGGVTSNAPRAARQRDLLATVRRQQSAMATQIAMLRDEQIGLVDRAAQSRNEQQQEMAQQSQVALPVPSLSPAELERRQRVLENAYSKLDAIRRAHPGTVTSREARDEIMVIANHWRSIRQWQRAAELVKQFLDDNPDDILLPTLRYEIARDRLAWAAGQLDPKAPKQELLDEVNRRFALARDELTGIIAAFADDQDQALRHHAQWDIAVSHLTQARVVARFNSTLARGQFVRAASELQQTADLYHDHPQIAQIPQMLWSIARELNNRHYFDEAITVWNEMTLHYPGDPLAEQAALRIAETYQNELRLPLRAVESYLELNFSRGGDDAGLQTAIFQIASQLMSEKRWVEALHVLETFIDSFPAHPNAGQALTMIGQVHQTNEVWEDAILAYRRVIQEYDQGNWAQQSKWSIAECTINLSRWEEAQGAYREYQKSYPQDAKVAEASKRLEVLKDLARFQKVVDEPDQRKAFDAQYQIGTIVRRKLANPVKAIIEYRKVASGWPDSHLADDALFQVGTIYQELGQTEDARQAFLATAEKYPGSPLADDALFQVGASFEEEAASLAGVTRGKAIEIANELAQRQAYVVSQDNRRSRRAQNLDQIAQLKRAGKQVEVDSKAAFQATLNVAFDQANASVVANWAAQQEAALTTAQLADRQDKINASLRKAVASFRQAAGIASADKADDSLLRMAQIFDQRLKDSESAMATWLEIVKQYSGTTVAEDASWKIAQYYESNEKFSDAISAYNSFLRNYRRSPKASEAQAAIAENHEQLGNWVEAMDAYTNYINNYPDGTLTTKAREQIAWIKTYRL